MRNEALSPMRAFAVYGSDKEFLDYIFDRSREDITEVDFDSVILTDRELEQIAGFIDGVFTEPRGCGGTRIDHQELDEFEETLRKVL